MENNKSAADFVAAVEKLKTFDIDELVQQNGFELARLEALTTLKRIHQKLETPIELSRRVGWQEPAHVAAIKIAMDLKLFEELKKQNESTSITANDIARNTGTNAELVSRIMRHLAAWAVVDETDSHEYKATKTSNAFLDPKVASGIDFWIDLAAPAMSYVPKNMREGGYEDLNVAGKSNWEKALSTPLGFFEWLKEHPASLDAFTNHLAAFTDGRTGWVSMYPVEERMLQGARDGPLLVDVGGGVGQDVQRLHDLFPQPAGRLFVQDLEQVVAKANNDPLIEMQSHDFFNPQPIQGSRAYMLHYVLHDWRDDRCLEILGHLKDAMVAGYSKLLVVEFVVAAQNADPFNTALDLTVMSLVGSKERTQEQWMELFDKAGMKMEGIFTQPGNHESVMEIVKN